MTWVLQILISVVAFVSGMLCLVYASKNMRKNDSSRNTIGISANIVMAFVSSVLALGLLAISAERRKDLTNVIRSWKSVLPWVLGFAVLFFLGNMLFFEGLVRAPNAGLARALMTVEVCALAILSWFLFDAPLSWMKITGVIFVSVGAVLVSV